MKKRVAKACKQEKEIRSGKILRVIKATIATIMTVVLFVVVIAEVTWCHIDKQYFDCRRSYIDYKFTVVFDDENITTIEDKVTVSIYNSHPTVKEEATESETK